MNHRRMLTLAALVIASTARAEAPPELALADVTVNVIDAITIIGSNRADTTRGLDATAPIHVITPDQIAATGAATLNEVLSRIDPSFNFPQGQNAVKGQGIRSAELRGVSPAYTLVLVNGKRRHATAQLSGTDPWPAATVVDLNTIPLGAIERIEVLKDGAAAQFGSDAIAGVVNVVLKNQRDGGDVSVVAGRYTDGGGDTGELNFWKGFQPTDATRLTVSGNILESGQVDRTGRDWRLIYPVNDLRNGTVHPDANWVWGNGSRKYGSALANGEWSIAGSTQAYGWINWSERYGNNYINPERVVQTNNNPSAATLAAYGPSNPNLINQYIDPWIDPNGEEPNLTYLGTDWAEVAGLRSGHPDDPAGKWDIALSHGANTTRRYVYDTLNPSWGPDSPTSAYLGSWKADQTSLTLDGTKAITLPGLDQPVLFQGGTLFRHETWGVGDIGAAWTYTPGTLASQGILTVGQLYTAYPNFIPAGLTAQQIAGIKAQTTRIPTIGDMAGILPVDATSVSRNVRGFYLGGETDLSARWQLGATGRYENYSDFGNSVTGKLTSRYEWSPAFALRGTVSSGFHAPSIAQLAFQSTGFTGTLVNGGGNSAQVLGQTRQFAPGDPRAAVFGAQPLKPEKSDNVSFGAVWKAARDTSVTVDAYYLKVKGVITLSGSLSGNGVGAAPASGNVISNLFTAEGLGGFTTASYYLNAWDQTTRGIDAVARTRFDHVGRGSLDLSGSASFIDTQVNPNTVAFTTRIGGNVFAPIAPAQVRDAQYGTPRNKFLVDAHYNIDAWTIDTSWTKYGQYRYDANGTNGIADQVFAPETYVDLGVRYRASARTSLSITAQNLFNRYPDTYHLGNRQSGVNEFSFIAPNGASGRFVQVGIDYRLP